MTNVFTYGTLMFKDIWTRLITNDYEQEQATLNGYIRKAVIGETYPVIYKGSENNSVAGKLYLNVSSKEVAILDRCLRA